MLAAFRNPSGERAGWVATLELKINYLAPVKAGTIEAKGKVEALRKQTAVARVDVLNDGKLVAVAQGTLYLPEPSSG